MTMTEHFIGPTFLFNGKQYFFGYGSIEGVRVLGFLVVDDDD